MCSYQILAPVEMFHEKDPKIAAKLCFDKIGLDPDLYRIGHTKASKNPSLSENDEFLEICPLSYFLTNQL